MYFLGIDIGTSGSRAVLVNEEGRTVVSQTRPHKDFRSTQIGWAEQDPDDWWCAAAEAIRNAISSSGIDPADIAAVGLSGQMHGSVLLDKNDQLLMPSIIWCDQRTAPQCQQLTECIGRERLIELVSNPALPNFTLPKLLWVRENLPAIWENVRSVVLPKDYIRLKLSGEKATDVADGSGTLLLDVANRRWSEEMLSSAGLPLGIMPALFESPEVAGEVSESAARETGLAAGTPIVAGAGDNAAGAIGMGIVSPGDLSVTIGTSGVVFAVTDKPAVDPEGRIHTMCHAIPNTWHVTGVTQAAGLSFQWFRKNLAPNETYDELTESAAGSEAGTEGLFWTPYLMGERTPHMDPEARASLIGLSASHTKANIVRAILEGVAFSLRDCIEIFRERGILIKRIRLGGGGARSKLWRQIQANVYNHQVEIIEADEGAALGAAILAGVGAGAWTSVPEACESSITVSERVDPDAKKAQALEEAYMNYRKIYGATRVISKRKIPDLS